jgi:hypothetical protein
MKQHKAYSLRSPQTNKGSKLITPQAETVNNNKEHPVFCLKYIDPKCCISNCEKNDKAGFADQLRTLSKVDWETIRHAPRHGIGTEIIDRSSLKCNIPPVTDDVKFIAFRYSGKKAMVGYRNNNIFHIIGVEKKFGDLYEHSH